MDSPVAAPVVPPEPTRRSRKGKIIGSVIALAMAAAVGALAWYLIHASAAKTGGPGGGRSAPTTTVGVATAERSDMPVLLDALGTVTPLANVTVRTQVSGILQKILFQEGQMVKAGQVLAVIDPRQYEMALLQATGQRQRDEAQLDNARLMLERYRTLLGQDSIARQDVDTQAALAKQLEGAVMTDRAAEGTARLNLSYTKVISPISGRVGLRAVDLGNLVNPGDTNGLAIITQLTPIDVLFSVPQDQVQSVQAGIRQGTKLPATALDRTRSNTLERGSFFALDNQVDVQTGTVRAKARFANTASVLFPSQFVNLRLELGVIKDAVMVPVTALRHSTNNDYVYILNADRTVTMRIVTRGQATVDKVEIKTGVKAGERVITEGADRLKDGVTVTLPTDKPGAGRRGPNGAAASGAASGGGYRRHRDAAASASASASASTPARPAPTGAAQ